jgi:hypothetical protein
MRAVSAAFLRTVVGSHTAVMEATVCSTYQTSLTPTGTDIDIIDGTVVIDGTADIRSTLDLTTDVPWPQHVGDLAAPYGNEIYIKRGIKYGDELIEWVGLGYFRIQEPQQDEVPDGPIKLTGRDRMAGIIDARLLQPVQFAAGATLGNIMSTLVRQVYPNVVIVWDDATDASTLTRSLIAEEDRFAFLDDLVRSVGKVWYFDQIGQLSIKTPPSPSNPVWEVASGAGGALVALSRKLTRDGVYNAVVAQGEATDTQAPVRAVAYDNNTNSPTYFYGRFGPVPRFYSSSFITTQSQAQNAAATMLRTQLGLAYNVDLTAVPNPALEPYDPVTVRVPLEGARIHVLEAVTVPLTVKGALTATTREQTVVLISGT